MPALDGSAISSAGIAYFFHHAKEEVQRKRSLMDFIDDDQAVFFNLFVVVEEFLEQGSVRDVKDASRWRRYVLETNFIADL